MPRLKRKSVVEKKSQRKMRMREVRQKAQTEVNIKAEEGDRGAEDGNRSDLAPIMLSDGG